MSESSFFAELKRRNVLRAAVLYAGAIWALSQGFAQLAPIVGAPEWTVRWFLIAASIGFPFWLAFAWFYEFTPDGLKRESEIDRGDSIAHHTSRKLDFAIIGVLAVAVVLLLTDRFVLHHGVNEQAAIKATVTQASIAVLPFVNMSPDKDQEYFSDGISEELLNLLAKIPQLQVTARTSSFSFKGKEVAIPEIARQLHVAHVLEGSVRKDGDTVRITAQLVDASSGNHVWSQTYDRKLDDIFKIQDEIAADVVKQLKVKLLGAAPKTGVTDPKAYALFLQARQLGRQFNADACKSSNTLYHQALVIDPRYAQAWVGLASNFANEMNNGTLSNAQGLRQAHAAIEQALAIDPGFAAPQGQLGYLAILQSDLPAAVRYFQNALELDPTDTTVIRSSALLLKSLGRLQSAIAIGEYVVARDPVNPAALQNLGISYLWAGRFDEAIATFRILLSLSPSYGGAHNQLGMALLRKGDAAGGLTQIQQETDEGWKRIGLPLAYCALERKADADAALAALIAKDEKVAAYNIAHDYAYCGEPDQAFAWLDKAVAYHDTGLSEIVVENLFDKLHDDPRWLPFLRKIGKAPEQLEKIQFEVTLPDADVAAPARDGGSGR